MTTIVKIERQKAIEEIQKRIDSGYTKFIHIDFYKMDGSLESRQAHLNIKKYLKGGYEAYDPKKKQILRVGDIRKCELLAAGQTHDPVTGKILTPYISIKYDGLVSYTMEGTKYEVY